MHQATRSGKNLKWSHALKTTALSESIYTNDNIWKWTLEYISCIFVLRYCASHATRWACHIHQPYYYLIQQIYKSVMRTCLSFVETCMPLTVIVSEIWWARPNGLFAESRKSDLPHLCLAPLRVGVIPLKFYPNLWCVDTRVDYYVVLAACCVQSFWQNIGCERQTYRNTVIAYIGVAN